MRTGDVILKYKAVIAVALSFCSTIHAQQSAPATPTVTPGATPKMTTAEAMAKSGGSLLRATMGSAPDPNQAKLDTVSWFAVPDPQPRTLKKHDLVTVIVREDSAFKSQGTTDLKKTADYDAQINQFIKLQLRNFAIQGGAQGATPPAVNMNGQGDFKGEAELDREDTMTVRVTGEVIDVKPNGTLVLQARQKIKHDEEEIDFMLSGTCRAEDVTPDNTVLVLLKPTVSSDLPRETRPGPSIEPTGVPPK